MLALGRNRKSPPLSDGLFRNRLGGWLAHAKVSARCRRLEAAKRHLRLRVCTYVAGIGLAVD